MGGWGSLSPSGCGAGSYGYEGDEPVDVRYERIHTPVRTLCLPMSGQEAVAAQERPGSSGCRVMVSLE